MAPSYPGAQTRSSHPAATARPPVKRRDPGAHAAGAQAEEEDRPPPPDEAGNKAASRSPLARASGGARFVAGVVGDWMSVGGLSMAASVAFYTAFSLAPVLVVAIAVASLFFGVEAVQGRLFSGIETVVGGDGAVAVQAMVASAWKSGGGGWAGWLSLAGTAVGATATFAELNRSLNLIWRVPDNPHVITSLLKVRLISFGLVVGIGFLVVVFLIADAALAYGSRVVFGGLGLVTLLHALEMAISFGFLCLAFSMLHKVLPDLPVRWRAAVIGGVVTALLFTVGKQLFARYLAYVGTANAFGAAGSLAVLMMWLFFSAAVFLIGAQAAANVARRWEQAKNYTPL